MGILELVLPPGREISTRTVSKDTMVSGRQAATGNGDAGRSDSR
ncbi:hypothetical protein M5E86_07395 [Blautia wexlerae]|nr:hypothetical protein M5E86_07395 [Blautia wexlerae]